MDDLKEIILLLAFSFCLLNLYGQSFEIDNDSWELFRKSANKIGFCIYNIQKEPCTEQSKIALEVAKLNNEENETNYFVLNVDWAKRRITNWAEKQKSKPEENIMLFDIDQGYLKQLNDTSRTSNSYGMFSILDLRKNYTFRIRKRSESSYIFYIIPKKPKSVLSNTMWREFMSNRLGRLDNEVRIELTGKNALEEINGFKEAFKSILKKN